MQDDAAESYWHQYIQGGDRANERHIHAVFSEFVVCEIRHREEHAGKYSVNMKITDGKVEFCKEKEVDENHAKKITEERR